MADIFRPLLELVIIIPGILLAYLPVKSYLKQKPNVFFSWMIPAILVLCILSGLICYKTNLPVWPFLIVLALIAVLIYVFLLRLSPWKSINIALSICSIFFCTHSIFRAVNVIMKTNYTAWLDIHTDCIHTLILWIILFAAWYPATHAAKSLVEDENFSNTWYIFWLLPIAIIGLNLLMLPLHEGASYQSFIMKSYIIFGLLLLGVLSLFIIMFYKMATILNSNARIQQENNFLFMHQSRYQNLINAIEETRQVRHDLRHHIINLMSLADNNDLLAIKNYLQKASYTVPNINLHFSDNLAVDSVISHYFDLASKENIPFNATIDIPQKLPVDEMDICLILSNLLENALEASRFIKEDQYINIGIKMHSSHIILLWVENRFEGIIKEKNSIFRSTKHKGNGVGIQSVRHIAEKNSGDSSFKYENGIFTVKVMLRGK